MGTEREPAPASRQESLTSLLGGRRGLVDASLPPAAFVAGWLAAGSSIAAGAAAAIGVGAVIAVVRLVRRQRLVSTVLSLSAVVIAAAIALHTGRAGVFFLLQVLANIASALAWTTSILVRWPLLGVVVGFVIGQRTRWRRDPDLLRAYSLASWVWVLGQYSVRVVAFGLLWWNDEVVALGVARTVLSWPLVAVTVAVSGWVLHRALPGDHPGIRHPRTESEPPASGT